MPTLRFIGRVFPTCMTISLSDTVNGKWTDSGMEIQFSITVKESKVDVQFQMDPLDFHYAYKFALDLSRAAVNMVAFETGIGLTVLLETAIMPDGTSSPIRPIDPTVAGVCTAYSIGLPDGSLNKVFGLLMSEPPLFMALEDLITSITLPHHAPVNCGRVVDTLRNLIASNVPRKQSWPLLRQTLRCSEEYLSLITDTSTAPRHGDRTFIPGNTSNEVLKRTWILMNRFLEFRKRGNQELPQSEFPILT